MVGVLVALLVIGTHAPSDRPIAERQADGRLLLSPEAEKAIDLRLKECQAEEKTKANAEPVSPVRAALAGLGVGIAVGVVITSVVAGLAFAASR